MKKITLSALALFVAALSFNVAAQDNVEKVKERIMPLIDGKLDNAEQEELFGSLMFSDDRLVSYKYDELENNLTPEEFEKALLVMADSKSAIIVRDGQTRKIGVDFVVNGVKLPTTLISFDYHTSPFKFQASPCSKKPLFLCIRHQIRIAE